MSAEPVPAGPTPAFERGQLVAIALDQLRESPTNPRKHFDPDKLQELAASVKSEGLIQPLLVRPLKGKAELYEVVDGACRLRAAHQAKLKDVPCIVRQLADRQVLEHQLVSNLQRSDLHPLEEAEGYERLVKEHGYSIEDLAAKVGKERSYIYRRRKLLDLVASARERFRKGEISPGVAVLIAAIPVPELQEKALVQILRIGAPSWQHQGPMTVEEAREYIHDTFQLRLAGVAWKLEDATLVPSAGACTTCPKRSGNQPELFSELKKTTDLCTDPTCFREKSAAATKRRLEEAKAQGREVIASKTEARKIFPRYGYGETVQGGYAQLGDQVGGDPKKRTIRQILGKNAPVPITVVDPEKPGRVKEVVRVADVNKALEQQGSKVRLEKPRERESYGARPSKEQQERDRRVKELREAVEALTLQRIVAAAVEAKGTKKLQLVRLVARFLCDDYGHEAADRRGVKNGTRGLQAEIDRMNEAQVLGLLIELALSHDYQGKDTSEACKLLGVDRKKLQAEAGAQLAGGKCRKCGCTEDKACTVSVPGEEPQGCSWVEKPDPKTRLGLCSACVGKGRSKKKARRAA